MKMHFLKTLALILGGSTAGLAVAQSSVATNIIKRGLVECMGLMDKGPTSQLGVYEARLKSSLKSFDQAKATVDQQLAMAEKKSEAREQELLQVDMLLARFKEEYGSGQSQGFPRTVLNRTYTEPQLKAQVQKLLERRAELAPVNKAAVEKLGQARKHLEDRISTTKQHLENMPVYLALAEAGTAVGKSQEAFSGLEVCLRENDAFLVSDPVRNAEDLRREMQDSAVTKTSADDFLKDVQVARPPKAADDAPTIAELTGELRRFIE